MSRWRGLTSNQTGVDSPGWHRMLSLLLSRISLWVEQHRATLPAGFRRKRLFFLNKEFPFRKFQVGAHRLMKRLGSGLMWLDFQAQARLFQCAVTSDVINPFVGQEDVFPFGCSALGLWNNMLHRTFVGLKNPLRVSATVIVALAKMPQGQPGTLQWHLVELDRDDHARNTNYPRRRSNPVILLSHGQFQPVLPSDRDKVSILAEIKAVAASAAIIDSAFCTVMTLIGCQLRLRTRTCLSRLLIGKTIVCSFWLFKIVLPAVTLRHSALI